MKPLKLLKLARPECRKLTYSTIVWKSPFNKFEWKITFNKFKWKQARKPRSYASLKLRLTDLLTDEGKV